MLKQSLFVLAGTFITAISAIGEAQAFSLSTSGTWTDAIDSFGGNAIFGQGTNQISWGAGNAKSSYVFTGINPAQEKTEAELTNPFLLGTFTHNNVPIFFPSLDSATLNVAFNLDAVTSTFSFRFAHNETSNSPGTCLPGSVSICDDVVTFPTATSSETITLDGVDYNLTLIGFSQNNGATIVSSFLTQENRSNQAGLYAQLTRSPNQAAVPEPFSIIATGLALGMGATLKKLRG